MKQSRKKKRRPRKGEALFNHVVRLTGIPATAIQRELKTILERKNIDIKNLTLEDLRGVAATYLREIMGGLLDRYGHRKSETHH